MKNIIFSILLILFLLRCDFYKSEFPITTNASSEIPEELLGKWYLLDTIENLVLPKFQIEVLKFENKKYLLAYTFLEKKEIKLVEFQKIWLSKIEDKIYINSKKLRPSNSEYFVIHKYRLKKNGILETTFLRDSFFLKFETQNDFSKYIKDNSEEFNSYFNSKWIPYQRIDSVKWGVVNLLWKNEIAQVFQLKKLDKKTDFLKIAEIDLEPFLSNEKINGDSILDILKNSYLSFDKNPSFKLPPNYYVLKKKDGTFVKIGVNKNKIFDFTNRHCFIRKK